MRGTVAKRIRREVYGDSSPRAREYWGKWYMRILKKGDGKDKKDETIKTVTVSNTGLRRKYQDAKKAYYLKVIGFQHKAPEWNPE